MPDVFRVEHCESFFLTSVEDTYKFQSSDSRLAFMSSAMKDDGEEKCLSKSEVRVAMQQRVFWCNCAYIAVGFH